MICFIDIHLLKILSPMHLWKLLEAVLSKSLEITPRKRRLCFPENRGPRVSFRKRKSQEELYSSMKNSRTMGVGAKGKL